MLCDLLDGLPGVLLGGGSNSFSSILAPLTYWHDFPSSTTLLSTFRDINLKPEGDSQPPLGLISVTKRPPIPGGAGRGEGRWGPGSGPGSQTQTQSLTFLRLLYDAGKSVINTLVLTIRTYTIKTYTS